MNLNSNLGTGKGGASPFDSDMHDDSGAPLPDFNASNIKLQTVAPAFGISSSSLPSAGVSQPDYLEYDQSRGVTTIMFTNSGISYMLGVTLGGLYGLREGLAKTPSSRFKVKLNSILNHCGRNGSVVGNMFGATSILYSLYEGLADTVSSFVRRLDKTEALTPFATWDGSIFSTILINTPVLYSPRRHFLQER